MNAGRRLGVMGKLGGTEKKEKKEQTKRWEEEGIKLKRSDSSSLLVLS